MFKNFTKQIESFFWGILAALGALVTQVFLLFLASIFAFRGKNTSIDAFSVLNVDLFFSLGAFPFFVLITAILTEEIFKYLVISKKAAAFSARHLIIAHSFWIGCGFAAVEIFFIRAGIGDIALKDFPFQELAEIAAVHICSAGAIGFFATIQNSNQLKTALMAVLSAFAIHFIYNMSVIFPSDFFSSFVLFFLILLALANALGFAFLKKKFAS